MRADVQYYMHVEAAKVDDLFNTRWPHANCNPEDRLAFRVAIGRELWESEDESYRKALLAQRDLEHENDLREYVAQQEALTRAGSKDLQAR